MLQAENIMQVCVARTITKGNSRDIEILLPQYHAVCNIFKQAAAGFEVLFGYGIGGEGAGGTEHRVLRKADRPRSKINGLIRKQTEGNPGHVSASVLREYVERILPRRTG